MLSWLSRLEPVKKAGTESEIAAVCRLRYQVYVEELKKGMLERVDHERREVRDLEDASPHSGVFFTGSAPGHVTGTLRIDAWKAGQIPEAAFKRFSLGRLGPDWDQVGAGEAGRLIISPQARGLAILPALTRAAYQWAHSELTIPLRYVFLYCAPGLVRAYRRLGFRPYASDVVCNRDGVRVPLLLILSDVDHLRSCSSPLADIARKCYGKTRTEDLDRVGPFLRDEPAFEIEPETVWREVQDTIISEGLANRSLLASLSSGDAKLLAEKGFVLGVPEGRVVVREELVEQEMFVVLEGTFEVCRGDRRVSVLSEGDLFGEMALFREAAQRTASVRALTPGKVLVLRRKALLELMEERPQTAARILHGVCKVLAERALPVG
jgi:hypothetical protein